MNSFAIAVVLFVVLFFSVFRIIRVLLQRSAKRRRERDERASISCRGCGYDLSNLEFPRCPECGALRGFKVPMSELGLSEDELRELRQRKSVSGGGADCEA